MKKRLKPYLSFLILSILAVIAGIIIYHELEIKIKSEIYSQLTYISNIKRTQISDWILDMMNDSYSSSENKSLIDDINSWIHNKKKDKYAGDRVKSWFESLRLNNNFIDAYLLNDSLQIELSLDSKDYFDTADQKYINSAIKTGKSVIADFHRSDITGKIHLGIITPLIMNKGSDKKTIALLLEIVDPEKTLFPLILSWPTEGKSGETLIVRADGDHVLYLNELRHLKDSAMSLRIPLTDTLVPAVKAVRGYTGILEGMDYRKVNVLAYVSKIEGTNWFMVSKEDIDEALAPLHGSFRMTVSVVLLFIVIVGITLAYLWKKQESKYYEEKYKLQKAAEVSAKKSLKEKEVLLRELNHRTKNNMQIISSLISLKASTVQDEKNINALEEIKLKILTISLVHEKLQQTDNLSVINLKEYLTELVYIIINSFSENKEKIQLLLELEEVRANVDTAISCGLILNELVSNSIKYAFPGSMRGFIKVELRENSKQLINFSVSDNGVGFTDDTIEESLGLKLFRNIAEGQLAADIDVKNEKGVSYTMTFRNSMK